METVRRVEHQSDVRAPVELSESTLAELLAALDATNDGPFGRRQDSRLRVQGQVMMTRLEIGGDSSPRQVGVYDISRSGIAIVYEKPMEPGEQFTVLLPRARQHPVEMICTARHSRPLEGQFVIGASYGATASHGPQRGPTSVAAAIRAKGAAPLV